jgi:integrase
VPHKCFPYVQKFIDRHGRLRVYFRKEGYPRIALPGPYGGPEFLAAYQAASDCKPRPIGASRTVPGSINALLVSYYQSPSFTSLRATTARVYRNILERFREEHGAKGVADMQPRHVRAIVAAKVSTPDAANRLLGMISLIMDHAVALDMRADNPVHGIKRFRHKSEGITTWGESDIVTFRAHWALASRERLAFELALNTGQRRGDIVRMGWQHVRGGAIHIRQSKTGETVEVPIRPELRAVLDILPHDRLTFIATAKGAPISAPGLGNWFRRAIRAAGLPDKLSMHGLRKVSARRLAESGCTTHEIMSITGHKTLSEIERYTRDAERARLAQTATGKVMRAFGNKSEE